MAKSKHQSFEMRTVARSVLVGAPYNPRKIDDIAKKKLRGNLKKVGLLQPIVWNETTGNIVSGHQRLACVDQIEGRSDYELDVAVVRLSIEEEKRQNVFMNNVSAMGDWDTDLLAQLLTDDNDVAAFGFEEADVEFLLPDAADAILGPEDAEVDATVRSLEEQTEAREDLKRQRKDREAKAARDNDSEFYINVIFTDREECDRFLKAIGKPLDSRVVDGGDLFARLR